VHAEVRVYDVLFKAEHPEEEAKALAGAAGEGAGEGDAIEEVEETPSTAETEPEWVKLLNPNSLVTHEAYVEPMLAAEATPPPQGDRPAFQFQRIGFFCVDSDSTASR
jgi:hypothetical protein